MIAATATLVAAVVGTPSPATLVADVDGSGDLATLTATVGTGWAQSLDAPSIAWDVRVKLAGAWVPRSSLVGAITWSRSLDSHRTEVRFGLAGAEYSVLSTLTTWTLTPVEIWAAQGPDGDEPHELTFRGWVRPGTSQESAEGAAEPMLQIVADDVGPYAAAELCHEMEPFAGFTRSEIATELAADVGLAQVRTPGPGAVYGKPIFTDRASLFSFLQELGEPEGWHWRLVPDPAGAGLILEAYTAELAEAPRPPDWIWTPRSWESLSIEAPSTVPSRWIVRGTSAVSYDEAGLRVETQRTEIRQIFTPRVSAQRQNTSGGLDSTGLTPLGEALRLVSVIESEVTTRGELEVSQVTREWAWVNPGAARLRTPNSGEGLGPAEGGYHYTTCWVDSEGNTVSLPMEAFALVGERRDVPAYDDAGQLAGRRIEERRWHRRRMAVRQTGDTDPTVIGGGVGGDDASYEVFEAGTGRIETYGLAAAHDVAYGYEPTSGAVLTETQDTWGWGTPRTAVDAANPYYLNADGRGMFTLQSIWQVLQRKSIANTLTDDGLLAGVVEILSAFDVYVVIDGVNDWGDFRSHEAVESIRPVERKNILYRRVGENQVEVTTFGGDGQAPSTQILAGRLPLPRYQISPWTILRQEPLELVLDDPELAALFGFRRETLSLDHIQSLDEALAVATRRRRRAAAPLVKITRPETRAAIGDTVLLLDPGHALAHRALVVDQLVRRDLASGAATAEYTLEVYPLG